MRYYPGMIIPVAAAWLIYIFVVLPWSADQPGNVRARMSTINAMNRPVGFLSNNDAKTLFYLNKPYLILNNINQAKAWASRTGGIVIAYEDMPGEAWQHVIDDRNWNAFILRGRSECRRSSASRGIVTSS